MTWEWISTWWKYFGRDKKLNILLANEGDEILAIAPLMRLKKNFLGFYKLNMFEFIGNPHSDYNSFILTKYEKECVRKILNYLLLNYQDWECLELRDISANSILAKSFYQLSNKSKINYRIMDLCPYIVIPDSMGAYLKTLGKKRRKHVRNRLNKLKRNYKVDFKTHNEYGSIKESMQVIFDLNKKRWEYENKPGAFNNAIIKNFHVELAEKLYKNNWLSIYILTINDDPIAAIYSFNYNNKLYIYLTAYDPEYYIYSPGNLLHMYVVEDCINNGLKEYDLLRGYEPYKQIWCNGIRKNIEVNLINRGGLTKLYDITKENIAYIKSNYYYLLKKYDYAVNIVKKLGLA